MFKKELTQVFKNKLIIGGLIIALFIPVMYSATFLWSFWEPYDKTDVMKVAIVNEDKGITIKDEEIQFGKNIVKILKENETFDWDFIDKEKAINGLEDNTYSMMIEIPEDFSANVSTVFESNPVQPVIHYVPNQSKNYMLSMIEDGMVQQLRSSISESIVESYIRMLASNVMEMTDGVEQLYGSIGELSKGLENLNEPLQQTILSNPNLSEMEKEQLNHSIETVVSRSNQLTTELEEKVSGLTVFELKEKNQEMAAKPLRMDTTPYTEIPNYGNGFAPFTLSLGLFIGVMVITMVFPSVLPFTKPDSLMGWFGSKYVVIGISGILQALIAEIVLLYGLGIEVGDTVYFMFFSIIVSIVFVTILHFLTALFKDGGRLLMVIMLILQITSSGGTFPTEMVPPILQKVSVFMPMTYSIDGFRSLISNDHFNLMWQNIGILSIFFFVTFVGTFCYFLFVYMKEKERFKNSNQYYNNSTEMK